jgi:hypothetical protein
MNTSKTLTLAFAAVAMAAGTLSAQTMKAEIPFAFRAAGNTVMQPGEYRVRVLPSSTGSLVLTIQNAETKRTIILAHAMRISPDESWAKSGEAKLRFACTEGYCALQDMWDGFSDAYQIPRHVSRKGGEVHMAEIALRPDRAD